MRTHPLSLFPALLALLFSACAEDASNEPSESPSAPPTVLSNAYAPPGARMLDADPSLSIEEALQRLSNAASQKADTNVVCDATPRVIEARGWSDNLVTAQSAWSALRASVPWQEFGSAREGFLICSVDSDQAIFSIGTQRFVSAEVDLAGASNGMLRPRADAVYDWERFSIVPVPGGDITIRSRANNRLVSAEFGYSGSSFGMLRARATAVGEWERFGIR